MSASDRITLGGVRRRRWPVASLLTVLVCLLLAAAAFAVYVAGS